MSSLEHSAIDSSADESSWGLKGKGGWVRDRGGDEGAGKRGRVCWRGW